MKAFAPLVCLVLVASAPALAFAIQGPVLPANDLEALLGLGQTAPQKTPETLPGPPLAAVPRADCGPGSRPLAGMQGRVTQSDIASPAAARGWTCNASRGRQPPDPRRFRVWRYRRPQRPDLRLLRHLAVRAGQRGPAGRGARPRASPSWT